VRDERNIKRRIDGQITRKLEELKKGENYLKQLRARYERFDASLFSNAESPINLPELESKSMAA
jgi:hypothetical protein